MKLFKYSGVKVAEIASSTPVILNTVGIDPEIIYNNGSRIFECDVKACHKLNTGKIINCFTDSVWLAETYLSSSSWLAHTVLGKDFKLANNQSLSLVVPEFTQGDIINIQMNYIVTLFVEE